MHMLIGRIPDYPAAVWQYETRSDFREIFGDLSLLDACFLVLPRLFFNVCQCGQWATTRKSYHRSSEHPELFAVEPHAAFGPLRYPSDARECGPTSAHRSKRKTI
jgi:hypothetical protein